MTKKLKLFLVLILLIHSKGQSQTIDTLINVNGLKMHFVITKGEGIPILFESGNGGDASDWISILDEIHKKTNATLITYDRAGLGKSEIDTTNVNFKQEINNLEKGLKTLGYNKKIFLVSHSFGSFYSSLFAHRNKSEIMGAVFIDVATPCYFTEKWTTDYTNSLKKTEDWKWIKQNKIGLYYVLKQLPKISIYMQDRFIPSSIPLTLIRAENLPPSSIVKDEERRKWISCLQEFGELPNHRYVVAKNADHIVWEKDPQLVIDEITKLYLKVAG
ncbi:MAG: alpha/beta fold hydrolase [Bacteroidia bacterium]